MHEDSASARIAAGQRPRQSFRHPQDSCGLLGSAFHRAAHASLVTPEALVPQHEAHAALQFGVFFTAVAAVLAEIAGSVGLAEFHRPQTLLVEQDRRLTAVAQLNS